MAGTHGWLSGFISCLLRNKSLVRELRPPTFILQTLNKRSSVNDSYNIKNPWPQWDLNVGIYHGPSKGLPAGWQGEAAGGQSRNFTGLALTMCGSWMSARLEMRAWLRPASSFSRLSLFCSISLFSSSIVFKLLSMEVIWNGNNLGIWEVGFRRSTKGFSMQENTD